MKSSRVSQICQSASLQVCVFLAQWLCSQRWRRDRHDDDGEWLWQSRRRFVVVFIWPVGRSCLSVDDDGPRAEGEASGGRTASEREEERSDCAPCRHTVKLVNITQLTSWIIICRTNYDIWRPFVLKTNYLPLTTTIDWILCAPTELLNGQH